MSARDSDESLMAQFSRGDAAAFETLYRRHELRVWRYLLRNVNNSATADDLMQDVWFAVARDAARYQPTARFTTWLFTIAHHRMIDVLRTQRRQTSLDALGHDAPAVRDALTSEPGAGPVAAAVARDDAAALHQALAQLSPEQREAFLLQVEGGLEVQEIAQLTQASFETAKSRLRYARTKLRDLLKEHA